MPRYLHIRWLSNSFVYSEEAIVLECSILGEKVLGRSRIWRPEDYRRNKKGFKGKYIGEYVKWNKGTS